MIKRISELNRGTVNSVFLNRLTERNDAVVRVDKVFERRHDHFRCDIAPNVRLEFIRAAVNRTAIDAHPAGVVVIAGSVFVVPLIDRQFRIMIERDLPDVRPGNIIIVPVHRKSAVRHNAQRVVHNVVIMTVKREIVIAVAAVVIDIHLAGVIPIITPIFPLVAIIKDVIRVCGNVIGRRFDDGIGIDVRQMVIAKRPLVRIPPRNIAVRGKERVRDVLPISEIVVPI